MISKTDKAIEIRKPQARNKEIAKKVRCITKCLGQSIMSHGYFSHDEWESRELEIGEYDDDIYSIGWYFYALAYGYNITFVYEEEMENLWVEIGSHKVFQETEGDVITYYPHNDWETALNNLYDIATFKEKKIKLDEERETKKTMMKEVADWLGFLKKNWNLEFKNVH